MTQRQDIVRVTLIAVLLAALPMATPVDAASPQTLMLAPGDVLLEESFDGPELDPRWTVAKGKWVIKDGALRGTELKADQHAAVIRTDIDLPSDFIVRFDFRFDGGKALHLSFNGKGHICRATITPGDVTLKGDKDKKAATDRAALIGQVRQTFAPGEWHTMVVEIRGGQFVARVDDGPVAFGADAKVARPKTNFGFPLAGDSIGIDNITIWAATPRDDWDATRAKLPKNKIIPPTPPTPAERFARLDANEDGNISLAEFTAKAKKDRIDAMTRGFKRKDKDRDGKLTLDEFAASPARKK